MLTLRRRQVGVTLIELMIASVIAMIILSAVLTVYSATSLHSSQHLQRSHLHQQLRSLMHLMSRDLRRAGYWKFDPHLRPPSDNPFQNGINQLRISALTGETPDSCILFSYDLDADGLVGVGQCSGSACGNETDDDNVEQFGFRLRDTRIQSRFGGIGFECDTGYWQTVNDANIEITQLAFIRHLHCLNLFDKEQACSPGTPSLLQQAIELKLSGQIHNQPETVMTLNHWIHIRNDLLKDGTYTP